MVQIDQISSCFMKLALLLIPLFFFLSIVVMADKKQAVLSSYQAKSFQSKDKIVFFYRTASPAKLEKHKKYPLLVFFHGSGGRGNNNLKQLTDAGFVEALEKQGVLTKRKSHVFAGQVPSGERWVDVGWNLIGHKMPKISKSMQMALQAIDVYIEDEKNQVDPDRIYAMGLSMGGYGTWDAIQRRPNFFAAAVPICGGGDKKYGGKIAHLPIWAWHGEKDAVIAPSRSQDMIEAIKQAGGSPKYSEVKDRGHNSWVDVWNSNVLWDWLYLQKKK